MEVDEENGAQAAGAADERAAVLADLKMDKDAALADLKEAGRKWEENRDEAQDAKLKELKDEARSRFTRAEERYSGALQRFSPAGSKRGGDDLDFRNPKRARTVLEADLVAMWHAMRRAEVRSGVVGVPGEDDFKYDYVQLPGGAEFAIGGDTFGSRLLVRSVYVPVFDEWWARARGNAKSRGEVLIGTPGIGKSMFLLYALYRLAQMGDVERVVYQYTSGEAALFEGDAVVCDPTLQEKVLREIGNPGTIYLVDGSKKGDVKNSKGPFFVASSPNRQVWSRVRKNTGLVPRCAPVCSLGEMLALRELCFAEEASVEDVLRVFEVGGGVPRRLVDLREAKACGEAFDLEHIIHREAAMCDFEACKTAIEFGPTRKDSESHKLFHFVPGRESPRLVTVTFGSAFIEREFFAAMSRKGREELRHFLASSEYLPAFPTLRGVLYEAFAYRRLVEGGKFRVCELIDRGRKAEKRVSVPKSREAPFRKLDEVAEVRDGVHHRPTFGNLESVDSFVSRQWLFQITVAKRHGVKITGLNDVLRQLKGLRDRSEPRLFFVVPSAAYEDGYARRQALQTSAGGDARQAGEAGRTRQFVLLLDYNSEAG